MAREMNALERASLKAFNKQLENSFGLEAVQVAGEDVNGDCMFAIKKYGKFTGTYIAGQTREEAIQNYKKFLE
jgi:uncharacterized protein YuzB (UPF0349 family)